MNEVYAVEKGEIAGYWNTRSPQVWYSRHDPMTLPWFNELAYERYHKYYRYLPEVAEFDAHAGEAVLEIGVGVGTDLASFAKGGAIVSGVDLTENAIATTRRNFECRKLPYDTLQVADAERLPFASASFDVVYSFGVLHHTPRTDRALAEVHRVLKPNGKAIVMLYSRGWKHYFKRVFINGILRGQLLSQSYQDVINRNTEVHGDSPLTYVFTREELDDLFEPFGEVDVQRYRMGEYFDYAPYGTVQVPDFVANQVELLGLERWLGENYIIKARKCEPQPAGVTFLETLLKP
jgi:SAM-dependent methyltransferase